MHNDAFDVGLIYFNAGFRLILSPKLKREFSQRSIAENFGAYAGEPLFPPADAAFAKEELLAEHRASIFARRA